MKLLPTWFAWLRLRRLFALQIVVAFLLSGLFGLLIGANAAYSALLGAFISFLPGIFFAYQVLAKFEVQPARNVARSFYINELLKLLLTIGLFIAVLLMFEVNPIALFVAYIVTQLSFTLTLIWLRPQHKV